MARRKNDVLQGTLDMLVLKTLGANGALHGYAITAAIQRISSDLLRVEEGSLYPALHRMEQNGWVRATWGCDGEEPAGAVLHADGGGSPSAGPRGRGLGEADGRCETGAGGIECGGLTGS